MLEKSKISYLNTQTFALQNLQGMWTPTCPDLSCPSFEPALWTPLVRTFLSWFFQDLSFNLVPLSICGHFMNGSVHGFWTVFERIITVWLRINKILWIGAKSLISWSILLNPFYNLHFAQIFTPWSSSRTDDSKVKEFNKNNCWLVIDESFYLEIAF